MSDSSQNVEEVKPGRIHWWLRVKEFFACLFYTDEAYSEFLKRNRLYLRFPWEPRK